MVRLRILCQILFLFFTATTNAVTELFMIQPTTITPMLYDACKDVFRGASPKSHYLLNRLLYIYDENGIVHQVKASKENGYWPNGQKVKVYQNHQAFSFSDLEWATQVRYNEDSTQVRELGQSNEFLQGLNKSYSEIWLDQIGRHQRIRKNFRPTDNLNYSLNRPPERTFLFEIKNKENFILYRMYDSSIKQHSGAGEWPVTKTKDKMSTMEIKYLERIPEFKALIEGYNNLISLEAFTATKNWENAQEFMYHQVASYLDSHYNWSYYRTIGSFQYLKRDPVIIFATVPKGMSKIIHKNLKYELLKDSSGKTIYTADEYEIMYLTGESVIEQFIDKAAVPYLKNDIASKKMDTTNESFQSKLREEFGKELKTLKELASVTEDLLPRIKYFQEKRLERSFSLRSIGYEDLDSELEESFDPKAQSEIDYLSFQEYQSILIEMYKEKPAIETNTLRVDEFSFALMVYHVLFERYYSQKFIRQGY